MAKEFPPNQWFMVAIPPCPAFPLMTKDVPTQVTWVQFVPQPCVREGAPKPPIKVASCGL